MEGRSIWTGKHRTALVPVRLDPWPLLGRKRGQQELLVEPEHAAELREFVAYAQRNRRAFYTWLIVSTVLCLGGAFLSIARPAALWAVVAGLVVLGLMILAYPFATPETIRAMGVAPSRKLARIGAGIILVMAVVTAVSAATQGGAG